MSKGALHFESTLDNDHFMRKLREQRLGIINSGKIAEDQGRRIEG